MLFRSHCNKISSNTTERCSKQEASPGDREPLTMSQKEQGVLVACISSNLGLSSSLHVPATSLNTTQQEQELQGLKDDDCDPPPPTTCWMRQDISLPFSHSSGFLLLGSIDTQPFARSWLCQRRQPKCRVSHPPIATLASKPSLTLCPPYVGLKTQLLCFQGPTKQEKAQHSKVRQVRDSKMLGREAGHAVLQHDYCHRTAHSPEDGYTIPTDM